MVRDEGLIRRLRAAFERVARDLEEAAWAAEWLAANAGKARQHRGDVVIDYLATAYEDFAYWGDSSAFMGLVRAMKLADARLRELQASKQLWLGAV